MKARIVVEFLLLSLLTSLTSGASGEQVRTPPPKYDEQLLKQRYDAFMAVLDYVKVATDYPKVIKDLLSGDSERQVKAIRTLGETGEPQVIPWIVPFLDSEDKTLRAWAGSSIEKLVSDWALKRRDLNHPNSVVLRSLKPGEPDLRPLAWVVLKMFRKPEDPNLHADAASMTRYLELREFEYELRNCLNSRHPAESEKARWTLESLGFVVKKPAPSDVPATGQSPVH